MEKFREKYIGNKAFYRMVIVLMIPMLVQNGISSFVNLLDNIMVGQLGTEAMSGVAIVNQIMLVYFICLFGAVSGASIFSTQYFGKMDYDGVRQAFLFKLICCSFIGILTIGICLFFGGNIIDLFLNDASKASMELTKNQALSYLHVMMIGMVPMILTQTYAGTLRDSGQTVQPMVAGVAAVLVNLVLNYLLIFGNFGCPKLGVTGAAVGTTVSRFVEALIVIIWTHKDKEKNPYIVGIYKKLYIAPSLAKQILITGTPLLVNEALWSLGQTVMVQCYSMRGLNAVAGYNIFATASNLFGVCIIATGGAVATLVGQRLGAGDLQGARDMDRKLIFFTVLFCGGIGILLFVFAPVIPLIYNTGDVVRGYARDLLRIYACMMPITAFYNCSYFTLRAGGKTLITFLFDSGSLWAVNITLAFVLSRMTGMGIIPMYLLGQIPEILKVFIAYILLRSGIWLNNIVAE